MSTSLPARLTKPEVIETYRGNAPVYDLWAWLTETRARRRCIELAEIRDGESILEVAVGTGGTFELLLRSNPNGRVVGVDLTDAMLSRARRRAERSGHADYELRLGDAFRLDVESESVDLLVNNYMFDLLAEEDFAHVLGEFHRVVRPGGRLVLVNMTRPWRFPQGIYEGIYRLNPRWMGGCRGVELAPALAALGLEDVRRERVSQLFFPSEILTARRP